jgi:hypothetical protein
MADENIFSGLKVVDLASFIAGPSAATILTGLICSSKSSERVFISQP